MSVTLWILLGLLVWVVVAVLVALLIGRIVRRRDSQVPDDAPGRTPADPQDPASPTIPRPVSGSDRTPPPR